MSEIRSQLRARSYLFALAFLVVLLVANVIVFPGFIKPSTLPATLGVLAPFVLVAMASTPSILSGGIDVSVGPLMGFTNMFMIVVLEPHGLGGPGASIPILLAIGAAIGALTGVVVSYLRLPAVIASLCGYFVLDGINHDKLPTPAPGNTSNWSVHLAHTLLGIPGAAWSIGIPLVGWLLLRRTPYYKSLFSVGGDDATAFSAGVNVAAVRIATYALGGLLAACAGLALTGLVVSADANIATTYTLVAIAAVCLGGTPIGGGRGGMAGSLIGAADIFLIQNLLSSANVSSNWLQVVYGGVLVLAVVLGARLASTHRAEALA